MKKLLLCLLLLIYSAFSATAQKTDFSKKALNEKLETLDGNSIKFKDILKQHKGKTIVVEVWASWCGDCIKAMPKVKEMQAQNPDASYVFISMDKTIEKWKTGIAKYEIKGNHFLTTNGMKGEFAKALEIDWIPRYIIIDKKGEIALYRAIETDFEKINEILKQLK
ncbi:MAG: TlpA family protein disulfide reductase [Flavobacterium sp.]